MYPALLFVLWFSLVDPQHSYLVTNFRPPAIPLIVTDPYNSYWSVSDHLYDSQPQHWSGSNMGMVGMIRIDSKVYRYMGMDADAVADVMYQTNVTVYPTQTVYVFERDGVRLTLTFSTPAMTETNEFVGMPVTFLTYNVECTDGASHNVELYYDNTAEGTVSDNSNLVTWSEVPLIPGEIGMRIGSAAQDLFREGSDRINWGYWYVSTVLVESLETGVGYSTSLREAFQIDVKFPTNSINKTLPCQDKSLIPVLAVRWNLGTVAASSPQSRFLRVFYDVDIAISYFGTNMQPLWKHLYGNFSGALKMLDHSKVIGACDYLDKAVVETLYNAGGPKYASLCSLAWRQATGGLQAVWNNVTNEVWVFLKEISSDGDVSTVDVMFPASPMYLWVNPETIQRMLLPLLNYAINGTKQYGLFTPYNLQWAPHHLGHWPVCDLPPNKQEQMPVEESGNMLMMIATVVHKRPGNLYFLEPYWGLLKTWADYIKASLPDPGDQLCTDDFEGLSPHNINLAAKGIVGLASYIYLLKLKGQQSDAEMYEKANSYFIDYFMTKGLDSDHYRRQFNLPETWSLKYNFLFQKILNLDDVFSDLVFLKELTYYKTKLQTYGIPLDDRHPYTKTDWLMWTGAFADSTLFQTIVDCVFKFANETSDRVPFSDWYDVRTADHFGFKARPVIGGIFARMLTEDIPFPLLHWK